MKAEMNLTEINWDKKISSQIAFLILIILSSLVALFTLKTAEKIVANAGNSEAFNIEKRAEMEINGQQR